MKDQSGNLMLAHDGTRLEAGQVWLSGDGALESLLIGVGSQGFPVFEKLDGWPCQGGYFDIEKYWKSLFVHHLKPNAELRRGSEPSPPTPCSITEDVRLWIAKVRHRLEHIHRAPITQTDGHALLRESIDIAQRYNCYESNDQADRPAKAGERGEI